MEDCEGFLMCFVRIQYLPPGLAQKSIIGTGQEKRGRGTATMGERGMVWPARRGQQSWSFLLLGCWSAFTCVDAAALGMQRWCRRDDSTAYDGLRPAIRR